MDDYELLQAYAAARAEDAFKSLAERYTALVYSAALRQTGNQQAAEDVTQAVFLTLAQKAGKISPKVMLGGWLLRTTRYAAANARRLEQRRQHYEREAMQSQQITGNDAAWQTIAPLLDEAVDSLPEKDRDALVLRFFEGLPLRAVAQRLDMSEDGVQKRVSRAVEKLRTFFGRRGRTVSAVVLAGTISANAVQSAPAITIQATSQAAQTITQHTLQTLSRLRLQILAIRAGCVAVLLGLTVLPFVHSRSSVPVEPQTQQRIQVPTPPKTKPGGVAAAAIIPQSATRQLLMHVVDSQTGVPVDNARLILVSTLTGPSRTTNSFMADANGSGVVAYSTNEVKSWNHRVEIFRDGYVPKYVSWSEYQQDRMEEIPAEYTAKVDPAVTIGGRVVDEQDNPIAEARVVFSVSGPTQSRSRERVTMMGNYHTETTDANGHWTCSHVPARFGIISFRGTHPQFQDKTFTSDSPDAPNYTVPNRIPEADFLTMRAVMRLPRGLIIAGVVSDENGQPIAGAKVSQNYAYRDPERSNVTAPDGSFRFENGRPTETALTLQAPGYAPVVTSLVMTANADQLRITLPVGKTLTGRVVDEKGEGISGASIEAASPRADSTMLFEWRTKTDSEGRFTWDTAPSVQQYAVSAGGYETQSRMKLSAAAGEQIVTLTRKGSTASVRILGQLIDADTRAPLTEGTVQIWETSGKFSSSTTRPENVGADGKFRLKTASGTLSYVLEAQAKGYWPKRITNQVAGNGEIWVDFALAKGPQVGGFVFTPAGKPAGGATLAVLGRQNRVQINAPGKLHLGTHSSAAGVFADAEGHFELSPTHDAEVVSIAHSEGFIEVPFAELSSNAAIRLKAWGRIAGRAQIGGKPLVNEPIRLAARGMSVRAVVSYPVTTDANGGFVFETVPPGEWHVQHEINSLQGKVFRSPRMVLVSHSVVTDVRPGETANVLLGGTGHAVFGRAVAPSVPAEVWTENCAALTRKEPFIEYRAMFAADGTFRIEDVPPGDYTFKISITPAWDPADGNLRSFNSIASLERGVTITPDSDLDLGALELVPSR